MLPIAICFSTLCVYSPGFMTSSLSMKSFVLLATESGSLLSTTSLFFPLSSLTHMACFLWQIKTTGTPISSTSFFFSVLLWWLKEATEVMACAWTWGQKYWVWLFDGSHFHHVILANLVAPAYQPNRETEAYLRGNCGVEITLTSSQPLTQRSNPHIVDPSANSTLENWVWGSVPVSPAIW